MKKTFYQRCFCIALIFLLFSPEALACSCRATSSSIKANMHTFQTMVETFFVDHGSYPKSALVLQGEAQRQNYWKEFDNPISNKTGYRFSFVDEKNASFDYEKDRFIWGLRVNLGPTLNSGPVNGLVVYQYISAKTYRICGIGKRGDYVKDKGKEFCLSNAQ